MRKNLKTLFDYQRFAQNPELEKIICDVEKRYGLHSGKEDKKDPLQAENCGREGLKENSV